MFDLIGMFFDWAMLMVSFVFAIASTLVVVVLIATLAIYIASGGDIPKNTTKCNCSSQSAEITAEANP